jgi:hypothetical protein
MRSSTQRCHGGSLAPIVLKDRRDSISSLVLVQEIVLRSCHPKGAHGALGVGSDISERIAVGQIDGVLLARAAEHEECCAVRKR